MKLKELKAWLEGFDEDLDICFNDLEPKYKEKEKDEQRKRIHKERMCYVECKLKYLETKKPNQKVMIDGSSQMSIM